MSSSLSILAAAALALPVAPVVEKADFHERTYPGRIVPIQRADITPQVSGEILEVCFENGAEVRRGDVLYRLDPVKYEAAVKNAEAKVIECKASVSYAELSYERHKRLVGTRAVSANAVDEALSQRDSTRASLAAAEAALLAARDDLAHCRIVAPIDGKAGSTMKTAGNYVTAGSGVLVSLVQLNPIRVRFAVSNRELLDLFGGAVPTSDESAKVTLRLANGSTYPGEGHIEYSENAADELTDTLQLYACFDNENRMLAAGGTVSVTLSTTTGVKRPAIPVTAVLQDVRGPYVWVVNDDRSVTRRYIARGDLDSEDGLMFVEKGLSVGERIVSDGAHRVKADSVIR